MPDNSIPMQQYPKWANSAVNERVLITLERSQKLDLLIHLLTNLQKVLIVCGPEGIGKTTLLQALLTNRQEQWQIYILQGSSSLSFESIAVGLSNFLNLNNVRAEFDLAALRSYCELQKVVLIIDDAGELVPGLMSELVDFSDSISGLNLVFSMTYDQFQIKSATDKAIDECHFIEIPPLNRRQCEEFLQNLSVQPGSMVPLKAVNEDLVENLFRETHGIPGKILTEIPRLNQNRKNRTFPIGLLIGIGLVCAISVWVAKELLLTDSPVNTTIATLPKISETPEKEAQRMATSPAISDPKIIQTEQVAGSEVQARIDSGDVDVPEAASATPLLLPDNGKDVALAESAMNAEVLSEASNIKEEVQPAQSAGGEIPAQETMKPGTMPLSTKAEQGKDQTIQTKKAPVAKNTTKIIADTGNPDWILAQPAGNYTLQVMVLSNQVAANRFLKKYPQLSDKLTYYKVNKSGQEKYVVIYGSFSSIAEARTAKAGMPVEFSHSLETRFKFIQQKEGRH